MNNTYIKNVAKSHNFFRYTFYKIKRKMNSIYDILIRLRRVFSRVVPYLFSLFLYTYYIICIKVYSFFISRAWIPSRQTSLHRVAINQTHPSDLLQGKTLTFPGHIFHRPRISAEPFSYASIVLTLFSIYFKLTHKVRP